MTPPSTVMAILKEVYLCPGFTKNAWKSCTQQSQECDQVDSWQPNSTYRIVCIWLKWKSSLFSTSIMRMIYDRTCLRNLL